MTEAPSSAPDRAESPDSEDSTPRTEPSFLETMKWALVMLGITALIAAITIPLLLWFE